MDSSSRRSFIKVVASAGVLATTFPHQIFGKIMPELQGNGDKIQGIFTVKLADYPELNNIFGSAKITFYDPNMTPLSAIITRVSSTTFVACSDVCTHDGCSVDVYNSTTGHLYCSCHGSTFLADGTLVQGPALYPLEPYKVTFIGGDTLKVEIPELVNSIQDENVISNSLHEVLPNIVIDNAVAGFSLSTADLIVVAIFDGIGNEILRLAKGRFSRGEYSIVIPAAQLSPGIYFCTINTSKGFKESRKFTVVR